MNWMVSHLLRLYHTLRFIKPIQLYYQIWYRIKNRFLSIRWYNKYLNRAFFLYNTTIDKFLYVPEASLVNNYTFTFIGLTKAFETEVDWNYQGYGKLWNYNLQYFQYLLDENISVEHRIFLLRDFSQKFLAEKVKSEPYPVSLRIINSLLFLQRHRVSEVEIEKALLLQINYLEHNLEYHLLANHLLENVFSLFVAGVFLQDKRLVSKSDRLLKNQLQEQVLKDGGHYECSPMYHSILLSKLLLCIEVATVSEFGSSKSLFFLREKASAMFAWMKAYSFPDGTWALFNDATLQIAPSTSQLEEAMQYLDILPNASSTVLSESGFSKLGGMNWELIVKTGKIQPSYQPGHAHADIGSFCIWYCGVQYVIDPGLSTYTISFQRDKERGTDIHNTLTVNKMNQSDVWSGFRVGKRAAAQLIKQSPKVIELIFQDYANKTVKMRRCFTVTDNGVDITDKVEDIGIKRNYVVTGGILLHPSVNCKKKNSKSVQIGQITVFSENTDLELFETEAAFSYHTLIPTKRISYEVDRHSMISFLIPSGN